MHLVLRAAVAVGISFVPFFLMQLLFGGTHCFDCGAKVGFPFSYMQDGTYGTHGHFIWLGFVADFAIPLGVTTLAKSVLSRKRFSK
ncbi:MAG TPA: hypothetical protein VMU26_04090 [Candidatus Polarisedimenticolia bacterium]|nr:hypothetical protein [Candidatus Polarisedimenticolia bacterium]